MKLNESGKTILMHWNSVWYEEDKRKENENEPTDLFVILENKRFIKSIEDAVGFHISKYGDDDIFCEAFTDLFDYYSDSDGSVYSWLDYTISELIEELKKYYVFDQEQYDIYLKKYGIRPW